MCSLVTASGHSLATDNNLLAFKSSIDVGTGFPFQLFADENIHHDCRSLPRSAEGRSPDDYVRNVCSMT